MPKYIKKAVGYTYVVEGFRFGIQYAYPWFYRAIKDGVVFSDSKVAPETGDIYLKTTFGIQTVHAGDYVYRELSGEILCATPEEFKRDAIKAIPNFDADKWYRITGIDLRGEGNK